MSEEKDILSYMLGHLVGGLLPSSEKWAYKKNNSLFIQRAEEVKKEENVLEIGNG